jgi:peptide-methionine (S)-S-oxide reductase
MIFPPYKTEIPPPDKSLPGRTVAMPVTNTHRFTHKPILPPFPSHLEIVLFGMGCFWGAERKFWQQPGVYSTAVGYSGGFTPNPTYDEVCTGLTGHAEVVQVVFDPTQISYQQLLIVFWESHNPTQGMRQGNDVGTQYRSCIYCSSSVQQAKALQSKVHYQARLKTLGFPPITTEILPAAEFYYAEDYHQQYLDKNPQGYCGLGDVCINYD